MSEENVIRLYEGMTNGLAAVADPTRDANEELYRDFFEALSRMMLVWIKMHVTEKDFDVFFRSWAKDMKRALQEQGSFRPSDN